MVKKSNNKKKVLYKKDRNVTKGHGLLIIMYKHLTTSKCGDPPLLSTGSQLACVAGGQVACHSSASSAASLSGEEQCHVCSPQICRTSSSPPSIILSHQHMTLFNLRQPKRSTSEPPF